MGSGNNSGGDGAVIAATMRAARRTPTPPAVATFQRRPTLRQSDGHRDGVGVITGGGTGTGTQPGADVVFEIGIGIGIGIGGGDGDGDDNWSGVRHQGQPLP
jgi:hypothetical protein